MMEYLNRPYEDRLKQADVRPHRSLSSKALWKRSAFYRYQRTIHTRCVLIKKACIFYRTLTCCCWARSSLRVPTSKWLNSAVQKSYWSPAGSGGMRRPPSGVLPSKRVLRRVITGSSEQRNTKTTQPPFPIIWFPNQWYLFPSVLSSVPPVKFAEDLLKS